MELKEIAQALVDGCREGGPAVRRNLDRLYAPDAVSVEAADMGNGRETHGLDGIRGKHDWWDRAMTEHSLSVTGPFWHGDDRFAAMFDVDATDNDSGKRMRMQEIGVYHVENGRIVREEFFYAVDE
ncbi:hypothetical protein OCGS_0873 [Oceaniovalibus guishaninsula JLT2003]|uniref:SnoaL-like domain-containing protein n=1 Tax=Oceaniovalibus guishaninsula JLT2003 TaxID=1231392 RepID=K2HCQ5_9RHOB|nr:nuclear transport factor 2 family protein [Oceaniovalibus guishaninsula]EKE45178.1 hypothetical protein OCGS_0873 [Oceaniovalibus guishaninsula JLT2003]